MSNRRVGGIIFFKLDGALYSAKGNFTFDIGEPKRDAVVGPDGVHGFKEMPKVPYIEGAITDSDEISLTDLFRFRDGAAILELANGKVISIAEAYYAGEGTGTTEEGEVPVRIEGIRGREISA